MRKYDTYCRYSITLRMYYCRVLSYESTCTSVSTYEESRGSACASSFLHNPILTYCLSAGYFRLEHNQRSNAGEHSDMRYFVRTPRTSILNLIRDGTPSFSKKSPAFSSGGNLRHFNRDRSAFDSQIFLTQDDPRINVFSKGLITQFFVSKAWHLEVILSN